MADINFNAQPPQDDSSGLRGGTQGGGDPGKLIEVGGPTGGTHAVSSGGLTTPTPAPGRHAGGTRTESREADAEDAFEGSRRTSQAEAKQRARDDADVNTRPGTPGGTDPAGTPSDSPAGPDRVSSTTRG